jgi:outer membrane protein TolC
MQRYRLARPALPGLFIVLAGCSVPTQRENLDVTARLVSEQVRTPLEWRLDSAADAAARTRADAMLADGLTMQESIAVSFLASPDLQLALERLEITRADFVAAATSSNPVALVGSRSPQGDLSAFYPGRSWSFGVLQNVIDLLKIPARRSVARLDLERARYEAANSAIRVAAEVAQSWINYAAALQVQGLREQAVTVNQVAYDRLLADQPGNPDLTANLMDRQLGLLLERKADAVRARLDATRAREKLGQQLGLTGVRDNWIVQQTLPEMPASDPDAAAGEQAAMQRRLDILAANEAVDGRLRSLAHQRRFRWLNQLDIGLFRDQASGGASFTGPSAVVEIPVFDRRKAALLKADSQLRTELRSLEATRLAARSDIRTRAAEVAAGRELVEQIEQQIQPVQRQRQANPAESDADNMDRLNLRLDMLTSEVSRVQLLRDYWRARLALALAAGDWGRLSGINPE